MRAIATTLGVLAALALAGAGQAGAHSLDAHLAPKGDAGAVRAAYGEALATLPTRSRFGVFGRVAAEAGNISDNVEYLGSRPEESGQLAGGRAPGRRLLLHDRRLALLDLRRARRRAPAARLARRLPSAASRTRTSPSTASSLIYSATSPRRSRCSSTTSATSATRSSAPSCRTRGTHTSTCVLDCRYLYGSYRAAAPSGPLTTGQVIDLADPRNPKVLGDWTDNGVLPSRKVHDVTEIAPGLRAHARRRRSSSWTSRADPVEAEGPRPLARPGEALPLGRVAAPGPRPLRARRLRDERDAALRGGRRRLHGLRREPRARRPASSSRSRQLPAEERQRREVERQPGGQRRPGLLAALVPDPARAGATAASSRWAPTTTARSSCASTRWARSSEIGHFRAPGDQRVGGLLDHRATSSTSSTTPAASTSCASRNRHGPATALRGVWRRNPRASPRRARHRPHPHPRDVARSSLRSPSIRSRRGRRCAAGSASDCGARGRAVRGTRSPRAEARLGSSGSAA